MENKNVTTDGDDGIRDTERGPKDPPIGKGRDDGRLPVEEEIKLKNKEKEMEKSSNNNKSSGMEM